MPLGATISPAGAVRYRVLYGGTGTSKDDQCFIVDGKLRLWNPHVGVANRERTQPSLSATCLIEAYAPASAGRAAARSRKALIEIWYPTFKLSVTPVPTVYWSKLGAKQVTVHIRESSGAAYFVAIEPDYASSDSGGTWDQCEGGSDPTGGNYSTPDTHGYDVVVRLDDPGTAAYTCSLRAWAGPPDIAGGSEKAPFTITVKP